MRVLPTNTHQNFYQAFPKAYTINGLSQPQADLQLISKQKHFPTLRYKLQAHPDGYVLVCSYRTFFIMVLKSKLRRSLKSVRMVHTLNILCKVNSTSYKALYFRETYHEVKNLSKPIECKDSCRKRICDTVVVVGVGWVNMYLAI